MHFIVLVKSLRRFHFDRLVQETPLDLGVRWVPILQSRREDQEIPEIPIMNQEKLYLYSYSFFRVVCHSCAFNIYILLGLYMYPFSRSATLRCLVILVVLYYVGNARRGSRLTGCPGGPCGPLGPGMPTPT